MAQLIKKYIGKDVEQIDKSILDKLTKREFRESGNKLQVFVVNFGRDFSEVVKNFGGLKTFDIDPKSVGKDQYNDFIEKAIVYGKDGESPLNDLLAKISDEFKKESGIPVEYKFIWEGPQKNRLDLYAEVNLKDLEAWVKANPDKASMQLKALMPSTGKTMKDLVKKVYGIESKGINMRTELRKILGEGKEDFGKKFVITPKVKEFLDQYKDVLKDTYTVLPEKASAYEDNKDALVNGWDIDTGEEDIGQLTPKTVTDLERTYDVFTDGKAEDEYVESAIGGMKEFAEGVLKEKFPGKDFKIEASVSGENSYTGSDAMAGYITLELDGDSEDVRLDGLYYQSSDSDIIGSAALSWDWAAWLGIEESPFYESTWADSYCTVERKQAVAELTSYLDEGLTNEMIIKSANELLARAEATEESVGGSYTVESKEGKRKVGNLQEALNFADKTNGLVKCFGEVIYESKQKIMKTASKKKVTEDDGKVISDYAIVDHGIDQEQYFQGHGVSQTDWETTATGIGDNYKKALEDALNDLAEQGWKTSSDLEAELEAADESKVVGHEMTVTVHVANGWVEDFHIEDYVELIDAEKEVFEVEDDVTDGNGQVQFTIKSKTADQLKEISDKLEEMNLSVKPDKYKELEDGLNLSINDGGHHYYVSVDVKGGGIGEDVSSEYPELAAAFKENGLTDEEIDIGVLVSYGFSNAEIANQLFKSEREVKEMLYPMYKKIGVESRAQFIVWSLQHGSEKVKKDYADVIKNNESVDEAKKKEQWVIRDWAGNYPFEKNKHQGAVKLGGKPVNTWSSFEDAEDYLANHLGDAYDEKRSDYDIEMVGDIDEAVTEAKVPDIKSISKLKASSSADPESRFAAIEKLGLKPRAKKQAYELSAKYSQEKDEEQKEKIADEWSKLFGESVTEDVSFGFKDKNSQIKSLKEFIEWMYEGRIENDAMSYDYDSELVGSTVEDQLTGVSGKVNGEKVDDIFKYISSGLSEEEIKKTIESVDGIDSYKDGWVYYDGKDYIDAVDEIKAEYKKYGSVKSSKKVESVSSKKKTISEEIDDLFLYDKCIPKADFKKKVKMTESKEVNLDDIDSLFPVKGM